LLGTTYFTDCSGRRRLQRDQRDRWDPAGHEATEEAHRPPRGKRPPETEINNINESIFLSKTTETLDLWN